MKMVPYSKGKRGLRMPENGALRESFGLTFKEEGK
jgi:hypothetical protein